MKKSSCNACLDGHTSNTLNSAKPESNSKMLTASELEKIVAKVNRRMDRIAKPRADGFGKWLDTLINEKGISTETVLEVPGASGTNFIPLECLISRMKQAPKKERDGMKDMLVKIDFVNASVLDYLRHLARAIAI